MRYALCALPYALCAMLLSVRVRLKTARKALWGMRDRAHHLHPLLALLLFLQQFSFPGNVTAVALGRNVLAERRDRSTGDDLSTDRPLNGYLKHLAGNLLFQSFASAQGARAEHCRD